VADDPLQRLAAQIERAGMRVPVAMLLDLLSPLDVVSSQLATFSRPLVGGTAIEPVVSALQETAAWAELRQRLARD
jgi:hypothetical protein